MSGVDERQGMKLMNMLLKGLVGVGLGLGVASTALAQDQQVEEPATTTEEAAPSTDTTAPATQDSAPSADSAAPATGGDAPSDAANTTEAADSAPADDAEETPNNINDQPTNEDSADQRDDDREGVVDESPESEDMVTAPGGGTVPVSDNSGGEADHSDGGEEEHHSEHFPIKKPMHVDWSFAGPFGHYDLGQLQRGLKIYKEVCSACHSMKRVAFRDLEELGYSEAQVKTFASDYEVEDGPNADGDMFNRPATGSDRFPSPFPNEEAAAAANNGAAPPDFSLLAKARAVERGFPWFIFDIFTGYAENGPDYIYSLLHGYDEEAPEHIELPAGVSYNPYFISAAGLAMAKPISEGQVSYDDGAPETLDQYSRDIAAFMMWAAEPKLEQRKKIGLRVMIFLVLFGALLWLTKRKVWHGVKH